MLLIGYELWSLVFVEYKRQVSSKSILYYTLINYIVINFVHFIFTCAALPHTNNNIVLPLYLFSTCMVSKFSICFQSFWTTTIIEASILLQASYGTALPTFLHADISMNMNLKSRNLTKHVLSPRQEGYCNHNVCLMSVHIWITTIFRNL